ncbi:MAG: hypothetical protein ACTSQA_00515 [Candidatus Heimdallarchaeaceae archaeon]
MDLKTYDCNCCSRQSCRGDFFFKGKRSQNPKVFFIPCPGMINPTSKFTLIELALSHPQGLNDVFKGLPFKINLKFCVR